MTIVAEEIDPATQAKGLKIIAAVMLFSGLVIGVGLPALMTLYGIRSMTTPFGVDFLIVAAPVLGIIEWGLAWFFWRRASAIERSLQGLPPRS